MKLMTKNLFSICCLLLLSGSVCAQTFERKLEEKEDTVEVELKKGKYYTIDMTSSDFDTYLKLQDPKGKIVAQDDDGGDKLNSRLFYKTKVGGKYKIIATSFTKKGMGEYVIKVKEGIPEYLAKVKKLFGERDLETGMKQAKKSGKLVMIDFTATWCPPCRMLEQKTFPDDGVQKFLNKKVVCVKIDVDENKDIAKKYEVKAIPNIVFIDAEGEVVGRVIGFRDPDAFIEAATDAMKEKNKTE